MALQTLNFQSNQTPTNGITASSLGGMMGLSSANNLITNNNTNSTALQDDKNESSLPENNES